MQGLIEQERRHGVGVIVGGFSQGAALSIASGLTCSEPVAGIAALSGYLPDPQRYAVPSPANRGVPVLLCHGTADTVVEFSKGQAARDALQAQGVPVQWEEYPKMSHSTCHEEMITLRKFFTSRLLNAP